MLVCLDAAAIDSSPSACINQENAFGMCSPSSNDVWYNSSTYELSWNYNNPAFINGENIINLYLLYQSTNGTFEMVKKWDDIPRLPGSLVTKVDDSWFPTPLADNAPNKTWHPSFFIVTDGYNIQEELQDGSIFPPPVRFTLIQNAKDTTHPTPPLIADSVSENDPPSLTGWMIAVIVIVSTLLLVALGALVFFCCIRQRHPNNSHDEPSASVPVSSPSQPAINSGLIGEDQTTLAQEKGISTTGVSAPAVPRPFSAHDLSSISSLTPITGPRGGGAVSPPSASTPPNTSEIQPIAATGATTDPRQSSSVLSSTDAIMIADTFRQFMRKPEWKNNREHTEEEDYGDDNTFKQLDENEQRKRLGDELLRKELAEEGTSVYQIERRPGRYNSKNQDDDD
ncbi:hypothetical protein K492DRAFT_205651 [Lichtheimia hyalospora FSU 10163]|nr:hypothetical protein K492DRAFT_205651 [Lichtheimia hyalospora FSU 10163]